MHHNRITYSQTWEDPFVDQAALNIQPSDTVLTVTSGGCNVLHYASCSPRQIITVDRNPAQNHLLQLKITALRILPAAEIFTMFYGGPNESASDMYAGIRSALNREDQVFWDQHHNTLSSGLAQTGAIGNLRFVRYALERVCGADRLNQLLQSQTIEAQRGYYAQEIEGRMWNHFTRLLPLPLMSIYGVHQRQIRYSLLRGRWTFGRMFAHRFRQVFSETKLSKNYFWTTILTGQYASSKFAPVYLQPQHQIVIRRMLNQINVVTGNIIHALARLPATSITKMNVSDIPEFLSTIQRLRLHQEIERVLAPGGRLLFRTFTPNFFSSTTPNSGLRRLDTLSDELSAKEMTGAYHNVHVFQMV